MSKLDAQRAMREAKYARNQASGASRRAAAAAGAPVTSALRTPDTKPARAAAVAATAASEGQRCGHKSMNGRACTREAAHPEKSHRYG
jgi:hypothetical protein